MATDIQFTEVTTGDTSGTGVFDQLMRSIKAHITQEYEAGRITGKDYATVYLGGMQSAIKEAVTFVLSEKAQEAEVDNKIKQGALIDSQKAMVDLQAAEIAPNGVKQRAVQDAQIAQLNAETAYTASKETVMEESRIDNIAIEALKAQMQNLATVGAGGLTPSTNDFAAANYLRQAIYDRARGDSLPIITFTAGGNYVKAT